MQPPPRLTLAEFRSIAERYGCRWRVLARDEDDVTLYAIERGDGQSLRFAVVDIWDETLPIPHTVIRSVCAALDLDPGIFGLIN